MTQKPPRRLWASLAIAPFIPFLHASISAAQILPDTTLGTETSILSSPTPNVTQIDGGALRGENLFHSFAEFHLDAGQTANFNNPIAVRNVFSRVTGGNPSQIFGTLGAAGSANLFFINPAGIVFGPDARLNVGGSFFATTAERVLLEGGSTFSAVAPEGPSLLSVNVPVGLQFGTNPGAIASQSRAMQSVLAPLEVARDSGEDLRDVASVGGLGDLFSVEIGEGDIEVEATNPNANGEATVAGDVVSGEILGIDGFANLVAADGREVMRFVGTDIVGGALDIAIEDIFNITFNLEADGITRIGISTFAFEIFSATAGSLVGIDAAGNTVPLTIEISEIRSVDIRGDAQRAVGLRVGAGRTLALLGGEVSIAGNLTAEGGNIVVGGLAEAGTIALAGDAIAFPEITFPEITFPDNAGRANVAISDAARLDVAADGGGNITVRSRDFTLTGESLVQAGIESAFGNPAIRAGDITIDATGNIVLTENGAIENQLQLDAGGSGGDIRVVAESLSIDGGARLDASKFGRGNAGATLVEVREAIAIEGNSSGIFSGIEAGSSGNGGIVEISTGSLFVSDGGTIGASNDFGIGNAGDIVIRANDIVLDTGNIVSDVDFNSLGNGGNIAIAAESLLLRDGSQIAASTFGFGNGGSIELDAGSLSVIRAASLDANTFGEGSGGNIVVRVRDVVLFDSEDTRGLTGAFAEVGSDGTGSGGSISIEAGELRVLNGSLLRTRTDGEGNAGNVQISAGILAADGTSIVGLPSTINSSITEDAVGEGGDIAIAADTLSLTAGAQIDAGTDGEGNGGDITLSIGDRALFDGTGDANVGGAFSTVGSSATGNGGNIAIAAGSVDILNGANLSTSTFGEGNAGSITVEARDSVTLDGVSSLSFLPFGSAIATRVGSNGNGNAGNIAIFTGSLFVTNGAEIISTSSGTGNAADIEVFARDSATFAGVGENGIPALVGSQVDPGAVGNGGGIRIQTPLLRVQREAEVTASNAGVGIAGNIEVDAGTILLEDSASVASDTAGLVESTDTTEANINIEAGAFIFRRGSILSTEAEGTATGGSIEIDAGVLVALENSDISANAPDGQGGNIAIASQGIFGTDFRPSNTPESDITATGATESQQGSVALNTPEIDPTSGLIDLSAQPIDASDSLGNDPCSRRDSQFAATGRGGLPPNPAESQTGQISKLEWEPFSTGASEAFSPRSRASLSPFERPADRQEEIAEATSWQIDSSGTVELLASQASDRQQWHRESSCNVAPYNVTP